MYFLNRACAILIRRDGDTVTHCHNVAFNGFLLQTPTKPAEVFTFVRFYRQEA
jgi:hypothetical protein